MSQTIFAEKYRPTTLSEVIGQHHIVPTLKKFVENGQIPHMMFSGPPGVGKTAAAVALVRDLYGKDWKRSFKEINASDDRGIDVVRNQIKTYASMLPIGREFNVIFLDEADAITPVAQAALRRTIERSSETCRFIFSCNYPNKIIEPIADRLAEFRFQPLPAKDMKLMLNRIVSEEQISITPSALMLVSILSCGSMRKSLKILTTFKMAGEENITDDVVYNHVQWVNEDYIKKIVVAAIKGDMEAVHIRINDVLNNKMYNHHEILEVLQRSIKEAKTIPDIAKLMILKEMGTIEYRIAVGCSPEFQLTTLFNYMILVFKKYMKGEKDE